MNPLKIGLLSLKLLITGGLLWYVFSKVDLGPVAVRLENLHLGYAAIAIVVLMLQLLLSGLRWYIVGNMIGANIRIGLALRLILVGQFFNQILPSSVGGDGVRAWLISREGISISHALRSVVCDRASALVVMTLIVAITLPIVILSGTASIPHGWPLAITVNTITVAGLLFLFLWSEKFSAWLIKLPLMRPLGILILDLRSVLSLSGKGLCAVCLTIAIQSLLVTNIYLIALSLGYEFSLVQLLMLPVVLLLSSIPISFAGWGLRESVMVAGLGFVGIQEADSLAISVSFGITQMLIGLPGFALAVMLSYWRKVPYSTDQVSN